MCTQFWEWDAGGEMAINFLIESMTLTALSVLLSHVDGIGSLKQKKGDLESQTILFIAQFVD